MFAGSRSKYFNMLTASCWEISLLSSKKTLSNLNCVRKKKKRKLGKINTVCKGFKKYNVDNNNNKTRIQRNRWKHKTITSYRYIIPMFVRFLGLNF